MEMISVATIKLDKPIDGNLANEMLHHFVGNSKSKAALFKKCVQLTLDAFRIDAENFTELPDPDAIYGEAVNLFFWPEKYGVEFEDRAKFKNALRLLVEAYLQYEDQLQWFA